MTGFPDPHRAVQPVGMPATFSSIWSLSITIRYITHHFRRQIQSDKTTLYGIVTSDRLMTELGCLVDRDTT